MKPKPVSTLMILLLLAISILFREFVIVTTASESNVIIVEPGQSIQQAINKAAEGQTIYLKKGVYQITLEGTIIVNKTLTLIGENAEESILNGLGKATLILSISANGVTIKNLTISSSDPNYGIGIHIIDSSNVKILDCYILNCCDGIRITNSTYNEISRNYIANNTRYGLSFHSQSSYNTIFWNTIKNNSVGVHLEPECEDNIFYQNNFIENRYRQVDGFGVPNNYWNKTYPAGGNYWSDYAGNDTKKGFFQNQTGSDGIGDSPKELCLEARDNYPLMGSLSFFFAYQNEKDCYYILISANASKPSNLSFKRTNPPFITFTLANSSKYGFCRVTIPKNLLWAKNDSWSVTVNDKETAYNLLEDENYTYIYFIYFSSSTKITVKIQGTDAIPEFNALNILLLTTIVSSMALIISISKKKFNNSWK